MRHSFPLHVARGGSAPAVEVSAALPAEQAVQGQGGAAAGSPAAPPAPPAPGLPENAAVVIPDAPAVITPEYIRALRRSRSELNDQFSNVRQRRGELVAKLRAAEPAERPGLEQHLKVLDDRIAWYERKLAETAEPLASVEAGMLFSTPEPRTPSGGLSTDQITGIAIVFMVLVLFPLAIAAARLMWKRATAPRPKPNPADTERLERLEHAVDTIAIEIERVAEGQRYVTKLLTAEGTAAPLAGGQRDKVMAGKAGSGSASD